MINKIKQNLPYLMCVALGLFNFIWLAIPYVSSFYSYDLGAYGGKQSNSTGISGYKVMDLWSAGFSGVMSAILQIFVLILGIALLAWGAIGFLKSMGMLSNIPDGFGKLTGKKLAELGLFGFAGLNVLLLVFLIILCASNTESYSELGYSSSAGIRLSAGIFITLIFAIGAIVALKVLEKKFPATEEAQTVSYVCSKCNKKAKPNDKFCNSCGGAIIKTIDGELTKPATVDDVIPS